MDSFRSALARLRLSPRARFCESSSWPTVSESSLDVLPGEDVPGRVRDGRGGVGHGEEQARLERPAGRAGFPDEALDERLRGGIARLAVEPQDDERELRPVRDVVRAVGEEAAVEELRALAEEVLGRLPDAGLDGLRRDGLLLEYGRGGRNSRCSGEMRRYREEHQWRRRPSGPVLTLKCESVGSKQD